MRKAIIVGLCWILAGCAMSVEETTSVHQVPLDINEWIGSPEAAKGCIFIHEDIDPILAQEIADKILALDQRQDVQRITLLINSLGGEASAFRVIHNGLRLTRKPVDTVNLGNCYSAACAVFASATGRRYACENAHFMVHRPEMLYGSTRDLKDMLDFEVQAYEATIKKMGSLPAEWFPLTDKKRFFTAQQALEYKFIDQIITGLPAGE
jgi:ATP-dependent Clp protease protease subunit